MPFCEFCPSTSEKAKKKELSSLSNLKKPFKLDTIPEDLLSVILTKMDQKSFIRMRRTNSHFSSYIDQNRHSLKIALFHNWNLKSEVEDCVFLLKTKNDVNAWFVIGKNFQHDPICEPETSTIGFEKKRPDYVYRNREYNVKLYLKAVKEDKWLQKEITGVIKLQYFSIGCNKPIVEDYWMNFLKSRTIESFSLYVSSGSPELINYCAHIQKPTILSLRGVEHARLGENVKYLKELYIENTCVDLDYRLLRNLEKLEVSDPSNIPNSFDVMKILELWCQGKSNLREITYSTAHGAEIPLNYLNGEKRNKVYTERLLAGTGPLRMITHMHNGFNPWPYIYNRDTGRSEAYILTNQTSKKRAVCFDYNGNFIFRLTDTFPEKFK